MQMRQIIAVSTAALLVTACQQTGQYPNSGVMQGGGVNKQDVGTVAGAIGGGVIGSNIGKGKGAIAATIGGALLGGMLGSSIGASLDNADRAAAEQNAQRALETSQPGQRLPWRGQNAYGDITPAAYYQNSAGQYCREYQQTITVGGRTQQGHGVACREPDGSWRIVE